ncbi:MAG TPA: P-loop NTPase [Candidatus Hydrogenedentes bacterium]|nr:P-loop NTPase [Candidatus Hydrogenedentota bacterium]
MADQAEQLREYVRGNRRQARVLAVTSGKGGVGKTGTSVNLSIALAMRGKEVVVLDADLGLANVEVLLGLNSLHNLQHVINGERRMPEILAEGPGGIKVVPGSSGLAKLADLGPHARQRVIDGMQELQSCADFIMIDTMAGISQNVAAFAAAADEILLVVTPEPSSIVDAYAMLKTIRMMRHDAVFKLVVNMVASEQQARAVAGKLMTVSQQYLSHKLHYLGHIPRDPHVSHGVMQAVPFLLKYPAAPASKAIEALAASLISQRGLVSGRGGGFFRRFAETLGLASNA